MQLGSNLVADEIKEGDDVYFECIVKSNPTFHRISWYHEVSLRFTKFNFIYAK